jgi:NAD-dependent deacetylase
MVPMLDIAAQECSAADIVIIVGTSLQVYPAAGLLSYVRRIIPVYYIDPRPALSSELSRLKNLNILSEKASEGVPRLVDHLLAEAHSKQS